MREGPLTRVLIVDDEIGQVNMLCDSLRSHGYETTGFTDAKSSLEALRKESFDLLISDLMMPGMDGIALLKAALEVDPNLAGIIMTGQGTINTAVEAMKSGAIDYILKPFKLPAILPVLSRAIAVRQLRLENTDLEKHLRQRTIELEAANRGLEAFSFSVSHDLRAPLRAINAFTEILLSEYSGQLPEEVLTLLNKVTANARRMEQLIEDLMRLSRLGRQPLFKRPVSVSTLVQDVSRDLRGEETERQVELQMGDLPDCVGDPSLLRQVFVNLLSNALKFTRHKQPAVIEVGARNESAGNVYFVRDNGAGFDMTYAQELFGVFQRFHPADEFEGNGVGLSIVHNIIQRHGGRIWAEAEVDKGATFSFTLPN